MILLQVVPPVVDISWNFLLRPIRVFRTSQIRKEAMNVWFRISDGFGGYES